jgi:putative phosphoesterase
MKILVFSDSHGKYNNMQKAVNMHPDAKYLLHLGDGIADLDNVNMGNIELHKVNGNFEDSFLFVKKALPFECVEICGRRIYMCHGHRHKVGFGLHNLCLSALENNIDIALYGHTHVKHNEYITGEKLPFTRKNGLYIFNPGSISLPRDSIYSSYGIIEIQDNGILLSHGLIKE